MLIRQSPLVFNIIVTIAAYHRAHAEGNWQKGQLSSTYQDALAHKQKAIEHAQGALGNLDCLELVIAATVLFIWVEILESGEASWRCHLDGLRELIWNRRHIYDPKSSSPELSPLFQFCEEHHLV